MPGARATPAVDMKAALARMGGNADLLGRLISEFCDREADVAQDAARLLDADCVAEATRRIHTAKGTAMILGLDGFSAAAAKVERALREDDRALAKDLLVPFARELLAAVQACERERAKAAKNAAADATPTASAGDATTLLERLLALLDRSSMSALTLAAELQQLLDGTPHRDAVAEIKRHVDDLAFAAARDRAAQLAQKMADR